MIATFLTLACLAADTQRLREHVCLGDRIAEDVVADRGDAVGGVRGAEDRRLRGLRDRVGRLCRARERRPEQHQHLVLEDQLLEDVDRLLFLGLLVFHLQHQLVALDAAGGVDLVDRELQAVPDRLPVLAGRAGERFGSAELDVGGEARGRGERHRAAGDERGDEDAGGERRAGGRDGAGMHVWVSGERVASRGEADDYRSVASPGAARDIPASRRARPVPDTVRNRPPCTQETRLV